MEIAASQASNTERMDRSRSNQSNKDIIQSILPSSDHNQQLGKKLNVITKVNDIMYVLRRTVRRGRGWFDQVLLLREYDISCVYFSSFRYGWRQIFPTISTCIVLYAMKRKKRLTFVITWAVSINYKNNSILYFKI